MPKTSKCLDADHNTQSACRGSCYWNFAESKCQPGARKLLHPKMPSPQRRPTSTRTRAPFDASSQSKTSDDRSASLIYGTRVSQDKDRAEPLNSIISDLVTSICASQLNYESVKEILDKISSHEVVDELGEINLTKARKLLESIFAKKSELWNMFKLNKPQSKHIERTQPRELEKLNRSILTCLKDQVKNGKWDEVFTFMSLNNLASSICNGTHDYRSVKETFRDIDKLLTDESGNITLTKGRRVIAETFASNTFLWEMFEHDEDRLERIQKLTPELEKELDKLILACLQEQVKVGQWDYVFATAIDLWVDNLLDHENPIYLIWENLFPLITEKELSLERVDGLLSAWSKFLLDAPEEGYNLKPQIIWPEEDGSTEDSPE